MRTVFRYFVLEWLGGGGECGGPDNKGNWGTGSGRLEGKFIPVSRDWLMWGGAVPPESARFQLSKHQNTGHRGHGEYKGAARDLRCICTIL